MSDSNIPDKYRAGVLADNPTTMFEYALSVRDSDPNAAYKYTLLAAQLGHPQAAEILGDEYLAAGDTDNAAHCFRTGAKAGLPDCSVKLAILRLANEEMSALRELEELAESGIKSACSALAGYYKAQGNRKEYLFWHSLAK